MYSSILLNLTVAVAFFFTSDILFVLCFNIPFNLCESYGILGVEIWNY